MADEDASSSASGVSPRRQRGQIVRQHWESGGVLHRNSWFHDWLLENGITNESEAYQAASVPRLLDDLMNRAASEETEEVIAPTGRGIVAGRALDLAGYLACSHPDCMTKQVDLLFSRVWHYFDNIAIVGPDSHQFIDAAVARKPEAIARMVALDARPLFHIRDIGADDLVTWVAKPPACPTHWKDFEVLKGYDFPKQAVRALSLKFLEEGKVKLEKKGDQSFLRLQHRQLFGGSAGFSLLYLQQTRREEEESIEETLARVIVERHGAAAITDIYAARSMGLPLGLGVDLEARLTKLQYAPLSTEDVAFSLHLPVVDGLPIRELIALRETERDTFDNFRDALTQAIKDRIASASLTGQSASDVAREIQEDDIDPALHRIRQRLHAAEDALRKNHRYNIALAGLTTVCGVMGAPIDLVAGLGVAAVTGTAAVEGRLVNQKADISKESMYFLWQAKEYADKGKALQKRGKRSRKR
jgi:hypothetical protein